MESTDRTHHLHLVRVAEPGDAEEVARLLAGFRDWYGKSEPSEESFLASVLSIMGSGGGEYLLGGDPAEGVVQLRYRHSIWTAADDCWLEDLFVEEKARGTGLGGALVSGALERARERGCARIELDVDDVNEPARALYARYGFTEKNGGSAFLQRRL